MTRIVVRDLSFAHRGRTPLWQPFSAVISESTAIVGANGSGKSTLLALLAGALAGDGGHVATEPRGALVRLLGPPTAAEIAAFARSPGEAQRVRLSEAFAARRTSCSWMSRRSTSTANTGTICGARSRVFAGSS